MPPDLIRQPTTVVRQRSGAGLWALGQGAIACAQRQELLPVAR